MIETIVFACLGLLFAAAVLYVAGHLLYILYLDIIKREHPVDWFEENKWYPK